MLSIECSLSSMSEKKNQQSAVRHQMTGNHKETHDCRENKREEKQREKTANGKGYPSGFKVFKPVAGMYIAM